MTSLTTEDFPYTLGYVLELLGIDERELTALVQALQMAPRRDDKSGRPVFSHREVDILRKAVDMKKRGDDLATIVRLLTPKPKDEALTHGHATVPTMAPRAAMTGKDNITMMVEAVSQVKEGILKDLSRLLDDKLSGLDEVVVELIRCKSENDSLKKKLEESNRARDYLEQELSRFKPVQFGFYRKQ